MGKIGTLFLVLVLCTAVVGIGYAAWSDTLNIDGNVATGELDIHFSYVVTSDPPGAIDKNWSGVPPYPVNTFPVGKDVGRAICDEAIDPETGLKDTDIDGDMDLAIVKLINVYPFYYTTLSIKVENNGTIPLIIEDVIITPTPNPSDPIYIYHANLDGNLLHPGERKTGDLEIYVTDSAVEGASYMFTIEIKAIQWNMAP